MSASLERSMGYGTAGIKTVGQEPTDLGTWGEYQGIPKTQQPFWNTHITRDLRAGVPKPHRYPNYCDSVMVSEGF